ncbi:hypothetical protein KUCAC02_006964, partial [Chaenocephalus aceratus]
RKSLFSSQQYSRAHYGHVHPSIWRRFTEWPSRPHRGESHMTESGSLCVRREEKNAQIREREGGGAAVDHTYKTPHNSKLAARWRASDIHTTLRGTCGKLRG